MSALAEALVAAQRRSLATLEKAYVAGAIDADDMAGAMEACGISDAVDRAFLIASLDVLKEWGVTAPTMTECVGAVRAPVRCEAVAAMNEIERTEVSVLITAALDFIAYCATQPEIVYDDDSDELRDAIKRVLALVYA